MAHEQANGGSQTMNNARGKFKNDFRLQGGFTETLLLEKFGGRTLQGFYKSWNIFVQHVLQSTSVLKPGCATCFPALCHQQIILGFILLLFFIYTDVWVCFRDWQPARDWTSRAFLISSEHLWLNSFMFCLHTTDPFCASHLITFFSPHFLCYFQDLK